MPQMNLKEVVQLVLKYGDRNWWLSYGVCTQGVRNRDYVLLTDGSDRTVAK
jgi:hypothetical protein